MQRQRAYTTKQKAERRKTLANELNFEEDNFEGFFSNGDEERSFIIEQENEEFSPKYTPRDRKISFNDLLDSSRNSTSNNDSMVRKRLVARVSQAAGSRNVSKVGKKHKKPSNIKLSATEFNQYLQKKYGPKKGPL